VHSWVLKNKVVIGLIVLAFFIGTASSSIIAIANGDTTDPYSTIIQAIHDLTRVVKYDDNPIPLSVAGSNTGNFTLPGGPLNALFYGSTLCRIDSNPFTPVTTILIEFGGTTLVQNQNSACHGGGNIMLAGGIDHIFNKGDKLILNSNTTPSLVWTEVARVPP